MLIIIANPAFVGKCILPREREGSVAESIYTPKIAPVLFLDRQAVMC